MRAILKRLLLAVVALSLLLVFCNVVYQMVTGNPPPGETWPFVSNAILCLVLYKFVL